jgi:hypothetical protein
MGSPTRCIGDLRDLSGSVNGSIELARRGMVHGVLPRKQPDLTPRDPRPVAEKLEELRRAAYGATA